MLSNQYFVYILANRRSGTLYIGVTHDLVRRVYEHKNELVSGFSERYKTYKLVYYEATEDIISAVNREKRLKKWNRSWKVHLIEKKNPEWNDLYNTII